MSEKSSDNIKMIMFMNLKSNLLFFKKYFVFSKMGGIKIENH